MIILIWQEKSCGRSLKLSELSLVMPVRSNI